MIFAIYFEVIGDDWDLELRWGGRSRFGRWRKRFRFIWVLLLLWVLLI